MKRYLLFYGSNYYPSGGWSDFHGSFDTTLEATESMVGESFVDWWQIVDSQFGSIVLFG